MILLAAVATFAIGLVPAQDVSAYGTGGPITGIAGKCLENQNGTVTNGNPIQINDCDSSTKQVWRWEGDMSVRVQGACLDTGAGSTPGTAVRLWACSTGINYQQDWWLTPEGMLKNLQSSLCLETTSGSSANGTVLRLATCSTSAAAQQWDISSDAIVMMALTEGLPHNPLPAGPRNTPTPGITVDYSLLPQWKDYMEQVAKPFLEDWYPALVDHYSYPDHGAMNSFTLKVDPGLGTARALAWQGSHRVDLSPGQIGSNMQTMQGTLIHEAAHLMQYNDARSSDGLPGWLIEGWADHARYEFYGVAGPSINANDVFFSGYFPTYKVLDRAEDISGGTFMKALSNRGWAGTYSDAMFAELTGVTAAEHWRAMTNDNVSNLGAVKNAISGKCLDLPGSASAVGTRMQLWDCNNTEAQQWGFKAPQGSSQGVIMGALVARCLSIIGNGTANGTGVDYNNCNPSSNAGQKWEYVGGTLRNPNSGKCLQPVSGAQTNGTQMEIQPCNGSVVQQWTIPTIFKDAPTSVTSKVLYPDSLGIGTTDAKGNGYDRILTAPANNTYSKPTLSPNGAKAAFFQNVNGQQTATLRVANADGSGNTQLSTTGYFISTSAPQPLWSTDNSKILVAVTPTGQTATNEQWTWLWVNADGSGQQVVSASVVGGTPFAVTSDKIYFTNDGNSGAQLCSVNSSDGSNESCFGQATDPKAAALSADSTKIASLANGTTTSLQLTNAGAATSSTVSLSSLGSGLTNVDNITWVPGTNKVAFRATVSGRAAWYYVDAGSTSVIGKLNINANPITWYANGAPDLQAGAFTALSPFRITDTRPNSGQLNANKTLAGGATLDVQVAGLGGVPAQGASAVVLNITEATSTGGGYVTVYPAGTTRPNASTVNNTAGKIVNNQTTVGLGTDGKVSIYNHFGSTTDIVVDVVGYYGEGGGSFTPTSPKRVVDTRDGGGSPVGGFGTRNVQVTGVQSIPSSAVSVVANVTSVNQTGSGFLTLYPSGTSQPGSSSMNYHPNETITKEVNVKLGTNGALTVYNGSSGTSHVIVDIVGYYTADMSGLAYTPVNPTRIADTRTGSGQPYAGQPIGGGTSKLFTIGSSVMPGNAAAAINNTTLAAATANTYLTVYPADLASAPTATSVTYVNPIAFNQSTVSLSNGPSGGFKIYNHVGSTDVVIDSLGYFY